MEDALFAEQLRELDKFTRVLSDFRDTVNDYFDCTEFKQTKTWSVIKEIELCRLEASVLLSAYGKQVAFSKACHNIYHIFTMFGVYLDESMDITASLFTDVVNIVYLQSESGLQRERLASVLTNELSQYKQESRCDEDSKEIYDIFCYLGSIIYNFTGNIHTIYSNFELPKRR